MPLKQYTADDEHRFWMVFVKRGGNPTKIHRTLASAAMEAHRLAEKLDRTVFILEMVGCIASKKTEAKPKLEEVAQVAS